MSDFNGTLIFPRDFRKILRYKSSWKCVHWEPSCSMGGREKDTKKLVVAFSNFANAPQNKTSHFNDKQEPKSGRITNFRKVLSW